MNIKEFLLQLNPELATILNSEQQELSGELIRLKLLYKKSQQEMANILNCSLDFYLSLEFGDPNIPVDKYKEAIEVIKHNAKRSTTSSRIIDLISQHPTYIVLNTIFDGIETINENSIRLNFGTSIKSNLKTFKKENFLKIAVAPKESYDILEISNGIVNSYLEKGKVEDHNDGVGQLCFSTIKREQYIEHINI